MNLRSWKIEIVNLKLKILVFCAILKIKKFPMIQRLQVLNHSLNLETSLCIEYIPPSVR